VRKAEYFRKINKSSLIIIPEKDCEAERDSIEMFRYNHIPYFLKMEEQRKDVHLQFCYDITSKRSLEQLLEYKSLDYGLLQMILNSFDQACMQTEDFMMTENDILLEPEFIFTDHNLESVAYCYLPGNQEDICMQFKGFMEYLLQHLDHKDKQAVQLAYGVYQYVVEERTALHNVLKNKEQINNLYQSIVPDKMPVRQDSDQNPVIEKMKVRQEPELGKQIPAGQESEIERQTSAGRESELGRQTSAGRESELGRQTSASWELELGRQTSAGRESEFGRQTLTGRESENEKQIPAGQEPENERQLPAGQEPKYKKQTPAGQVLGNECQTTIENKWFHPGNIEQGQFQQELIERPLPKTEQKKNEKALKSKMKKTEQMQESILSHNTDQVSKIKQKETLRKQAAEKLKNMLKKKIYTDRARYTEENTVFEADEEEVVFSNPTVCLMPETDGLQNQFVYQGADRSRDFHCMQGKMLLGSDRKESDIYIPFPMVSRVHARIEIDARGTFLEDMNSTNGTHVNGELLQYREKRMLQKGDIISLAGECYSFH